MKNIIPFKKDVIFKTKLSEITSISLEHTLAIEKDLIKGEFIINGEYRVSEKSISVDPFNLEIPFEIMLDERFDTKNATVDIDDFYYEIVNNNVLSISIDVLVDKLEEKSLVQLDDLTEIVHVRENLPIEEETDMDQTNNEDIFVDNEESVDENLELKNDEVMRNNILKNVEEKDEKINSLFSQFSSDNEVYVAYNVYILREGDSIETIKEKYNVSEEELKKYNDLNNLKLGDKIIIPNTYEGN